MVNLGPLDPDICLGCGAHPARCHCHADKLHSPALADTGEAGRRTGTERVGPRSRWRAIVQQRGGPIAFWSAWSALWLTVTVALIAYDWARH